jgi:hypothetical protein
MPLLHETPSVLRFIVTSSAASVVSILFQLHQQTTPYDVIREGVTSAPLEYACVLSHQVITSLVCITFGYLRNAVVKSLGPVETRLSFVIFGEDSYSTPAILSLL